MADATPQSCCIEAVSDSICMMDKKNFFSAVSVRHEDADLVQIIDTGDLVVLKDSSSVPANEQFVKKKDWRVGQVTGFYFAGQQKRIFVQLLWPHSHMKRRLSQDSKRFLKKNERSDILLFRYAPPGVEIREYPISQVQPVKVTLDTFPIDKPMRIEVDNEDVLEWRFQIRNFVVNADGTLKGCKDGFVSGAPPDSVLEGWKSFPDGIVKNTDKLGIKFRKQYKRVNEDRFQLVEKVPIPEPSEKVTHKRKSRDDSGPSKSLVTDSKKSRAARPNDSEPSNKTNKRKMQPPQETRELKKRAPSTSSVALGPVVFTSRKGKLEFFDRFELAAKRKLKFRVGDLVLVSSDKTPGQILSIYRDANRNIWTEIRWFYTAAEDFPAGVVLPSGAGDVNEVFEVDEHVGQVEATSLVGLMKLSSTHRKGCKLCRYGFSFADFTGSEGLYPVSHWSGESNSVRSLNCPKAWPGKIRKLLNVYGGSTGDLCLHEPVVDRATRSWSTKQLNLDTAAPTQPKLHTTTQASYWSSFKLRLGSTRWTFGITRALTVCLGDVVCIADVGECGHCHPFLGPWRVAQVLSIYNSTDAPNAPLRLEVRWFRRRVEFPKELQDWMPNSKDTSIAAIFETCKVESDVPANRVLAGVNLLFPGESKNEDVGGSYLPLRCHYFFLDSPVRFQPIPTAGLDFTSWSRRLLDRGMSMSHCMQENQLLEQAVKFHLDDTSARKEFPNLFSSVNSLLCDQSGQPMSDNPQPMPKGLFRSCSCATLLSKFTNETNLIVSSSAHEVFRWTIRVGDIVAIESPSHPQMHPFSVGWRPAQVVAIYAHPLESDNGKKIQVREFHLFNTKGGSQSATVAGLPQLLSSEEICQEAIKPIDVLGPVHIVPGSIEDQSGCPWNRVWESHFPGIPISLFAYAGHVRSNDGTIQHEDFCELVPKGLKLSDHYDERSRAAMMQVLCDESNYADGESPQLPMQCYRQSRKDDDSTSSSIGRTASEKNESDHCSVSWFPTAPIYSDTANGVEFFDQLGVIPPKRIFLQGGDREPGGVWTVALGDLVVVRFRGKSAGKPVYLKQSSSGRDTKLFPGSWAVAEVVTMWKQAEEYRLEIRWFFRNGEIPGVAQPSVSGVGSLTCEEIYESDLYDEVCASCVWAPTCLYDKPRDVTTGLTRFGLPVVEFFCRQSWSATRRCLMPIDNMERRIDRGREKSPMAKKNPSLRFAFAEAFTPFVPQPNGSTECMEAFQDVVDKLSLTDASKEAHKNISSIVGRSNEKKELALFIRDAVQGRSTSGKRPSLFVAGPPGTGKTACIKAVVNDLQSKKQGTCGSFQFLTLNGMETRHPHDIYSLFLENLDIEESRCNAKTAARKLEKYFCSRSAEDSEPEEVYVVLVDEIDYLVTSTQEVLYDLFNWPIRSVESGSKRRLVVIGVSNTLTLPDNLHPRVRSRVGSKRVFFKAYAVDEIKAILTSKVRSASPNYQVFHDDAILYASKKTAALSGDIRKAFNICKLAAEMIIDQVRAENSLASGTPIVKIMDVLRVSRESFNSALSQMITTCNPFEALLLITLGTLSKTTGREYGGFDIEEVVTKMTSIANAHGDPTLLPPPNLEETLGIVSRLGEVSLLSLETPRDVSLSHSAGDKPQQTRTEVLGEKLLNQQLHRLLSVSTSGYGRDNVLVLQTDADHDSLYQAPGIRLV